MLRTTLSSSLPFCSMAALATCSTTLGFLASEMFKRHIANFWQDIFERNAACKNQFSNQDYDSGKTGFVIIAT